MSDFSCVLCVSWLKIGLLVTDKSCAKTVKYGRRIRVNDFSGLGKILVIMGLILAGIGLLFWLGGKIPGLGKLPGDIVFRRGNFTFYFPIVTCILVSIVLSIILGLFGRK